MSATEDKDSWYRNVPRSFRICTAKDYDPVVHFHALWMHKLNYQKPLPVVFDEHFNKIKDSYSPSNGVFTAPQDGTYLARVRVGAMDPESSEWIFPDFKVITKTEDDILTLKVNVTDPEDSRLFFPPPKQLKLSKGDSVKLVVESQVPDDQWKGLIPGITVWIYDVMALLN
ncbi:hypothetical protein PoB_003167500 [Plakobranchus ocellatus]|uniref:C1q domain-containing protein n=1 Tax=Plakobranchus ocellatus TaxID=259542 RepID=A0AAV4AAH2_9GAST|nr:hypothetical protein PoB_003167500 [Plakobranchus ocellatus]